MHNNRKQNIINERSKSRLQKEIKKRIQTTMIGSLSSMEKFFGFLWGEESDEELSREQEHMRELFDEMRTEILDKGNSQIRHAESEVENYEITWNKYHINLPIKKF